MAMVNPAAVGMGLNFSLLQEGVEVRVARIFNTFGPRMHMNDGRVVSNFILQALQGEPLTVRGQHAGVGMSSRGLRVRASHPGELALNPMSHCPQREGGSSWEL